jgi:methyl-accepting chemotaxis protein
MANTAPVRFLTIRFHLESTTATSDARFEGKLASIREENREIASRTINVASDIFADSAEAARREAADPRGFVRQRFVVAVESTDPPQCSTRFEENIAADPGSFAGKQQVVGVLRGGHSQMAYSRQNRKYSLPKRPGEKTLNMANSGSRRIFDDRAGFAAARNVHRLSYCGQVSRS